jgi:hypothetical protein
VEFVRVGNPVDAGYFGPATVKHHGDSP